MPQGNEPQAHEGAATGEDDSSVCCYCAASCTDDDMVAGTETHDEPLFICVGCCKQFYREYLVAAERELQEWIRAKGLDH